MAFSTLRKILYGPYRPWIEEEKSQISLPEGPFESDSEMEWWGRVEPIKPFNRAAMAYSMTISHSMRHRLQEVVSSMRTTKAKTDRSYLITTAVREVEDFIREAQGVQGERSSGDKMVQYVTDMIIRELLNLRRELLLRYPVPQKHDPSVEKVCLRLLVRPAPSPSPFGFTLAYYQYRLQQALPAVVAAESDKPISVQPLLEIWNELAIMVTAHNTFDDLRWVQNLMQHTENALFLMKGEAAFIEAEPERLAESDHCRVWAMGMIEDAMEDGVPDAEACQKLYSAGIWVRNGLAPVYKMLPETPIPQPYAGRLK